MKTRCIEQEIRIGVIVGAEEDRCYEDSLEALNNSSVVTAIGSKVEEFQHLKGSFKMDCATFLLHSEGGYPNRNRPVLAERQAIIGMSRDLEKVLSVPSRMSQLAGLWTPEREAAEDKRPGVEGEFLFPGVALLASKLDGFQLSKPPLGHGNAGKTLADCGGNRGQKSVSVRVSVNPENQVFSCRSLAHAGWRKLLET